MVFDSIQWYKAMDYADLLRMLQQYSGKKIRLLGANTGTGDCVYYANMPMQFTAIFHHGNISV